ncbi:MAG TPA: hypothetical protein VN512_00235 [Clostridia bacterium]|nr:hypothetical protein [Clostridia bacterium]
MEVKRSANPDVREMKKFAVLDKTSLVHSNGGILCMREALVPIDAQNCSIPGNLL